MTGKQKTLYKPAKLHLSTHKKLKDLRKELKTPAVKIIEELVNDLHLTVFGEIG